MGLAQVTSCRKRLQEAVTFCGHKYVIGLDHDLQVWRAHEGVQLGPLQGQLDQLPPEGPWSYPLRRSVVSQSDRDATMMRACLVSLRKPVREVLAAYEQAARLLENEEKG